MMLLQASSTPSTMSVRWRSENGKRLEEAPHTIPHQREIAGVTGEFDFSSFSSIAPGAEPIPDPFRCKAGQFRIGSQRVSVA